MFVEFTIEAERELVRKWEVGTSNTDKGKTKVRKSEMKRMGPEKVVWPFFQQVLGSVWREVM